MPTSPRLVTGVARTLVPALALTLATPASGQSCGGQWLPGEPVPGVALGGTGSGIGSVTALLPLPSGEIIVGGSFIAAGDVGAGSIANYDPVARTWLPLGSGVRSLTRSQARGVVLALGRLPDGDILAGGAGLLQSEPSSPFTSLARWDSGSATWTAIDSPFNTIQSLVVLPDGGVLAGGSSLSETLVARWNAATGTWTQFSVIPGPTINGLGTFVFAIALDAAAGVAYICGNFTGIAGQPANSIARFDLATSSVTAMGSGIPGVVGAITVLPDGSVLAGSFLTENGQNPSPAVLRWDPALETWSGLGTGPTGSVRGFAVLPDNTLYALGSFVRSPLGTFGAARWNPVAGAWDLIDTGFLGFTDVRAAAALPNAEVLLAGIGFVGGIGFLGSNTAGINLSRYDPSTGQVTPASPGVHAFPQVFGASPAGDIVAAQNSIPGTGAPFHFASRWSPQISGWEPLLVQTRPMESSTLSTLVPLPDGSIFASGSLSPLLGPPNARFAVGRWTPELQEFFDLGGPGWSTNSVRTTVQIPGTGDVLLGGSFNAPSSSGQLQYLARWNAENGSFSPIPGGPTSGEVSDVIALPNGDIIAAGSFSINIPGVPFSTSSRDVARRSAATGTWSAYGAGPPRGDIRAITLLPGGDLLAANTREIYRWSSSAATWTTVGVVASPGSATDVREMLTLPSGDVVVAGTFFGIGTIPAANIARYNPASGQWSPLGTGLVAGNLGNSGRAVTGLTLLPSGELAATGTFVLAGGHVSSGWARWSETGVPAVVRQPEPRALAAGGTVTLSAAVPSGYAGLTLRWRRNGAEIVDGPGGASTGGGTVTGATITLPSPSTGQPVTLTITNAQRSDAGLYTAVFTNACGTITSSPAGITVTPGCPADFTGDGVRAPADLFAFVRAYFAGCTTAGTGPCQYGSADFTGDSTLTPTDIFTFLNAYFAGC